VIVEGESLCTCCVTSEASAPAFSRACTISSAVAACSKQRNKYILYNGYQHFNIRASKLVESAMKHHKDGIHKEFAFCISPGCVAYASIVLLQARLRIHCDIGRLLATAIET
jgi:hypothetical protein